MKRQDRWFIREVSAAFVLQEEDRGTKSVFNADAHLYY